MMTPASLLSEISNDPASLGYAASVASGSDAAIAALLNATTGPGASTVVQPVDAGHLLIWSALTGTRKAIEANLPNADPIVASACLAVRDALGGGAGQLDLTNPYIAGTGGLLDKLTSGGVLPANADNTGASPTPGSKAHLLAYGSRPCSRAEALWGAGSAVTIADISLALRGVR